jgi:hypothetical protein
VVSSAQAGDSIFDETVDALQELLRCTFYRGSGPAPQHSPPNDTPLSALLRLFSRLLSFYLDEHAASLWVAAPLRRVRAVVACVRQQAAVIPQRLYKCIASLSRQNADGVAASVDECSFILTYYTAFPFPSYTCGTPPPSTLREHCSKLSDTMMSGFESSQHWSDYVSMSDTLRDKSGSLRHCIPTATVQ